MCSYFPSYSLNSVNQNTSIIVNVNVILHDRTYNLAMQLVEAEQNSTDVNFHRNIQACFYENIQLMLVTRLSIKLP